MDREGFIPPDKVPRSSNYRQASGRDGVIDGGVRVGMPPDPGRFDLDNDADAQDELMDGLDGMPLGPVNAFGANMIAEGKLDARDIYGNNPEYEGYSPPRTAAPHDQFAAVDRYDRGTPGGGDPFEDPYIHRMREEAGRLCDAALDAEALGDYESAEAYADQAESLMEQADAQSSTSGFDGLGDVPSGFADAFREGDPWRGR